MYQLRFSGLWLATGVFLIIAILYLSLAPGGLPVPVTLNDKLGHFLAYTVLMIWFGGIFKRRGQWGFVLAFFFMGVAIEFLQGWGGVRMFDMTDMAMNGLGIALGKKLCRVGLSGWCQKIERLVLKPQS